MNNSDPHIGKSATINVDHHQISFIRHTNIKFAELYEERLHIRARYGWLKLLMNKHPYVTVTCETWSMSKDSNVDEPETFGAFYGEISRAFPELTTMSDLHLSDAITGEPMHSLANGFYFIERGQFDTAAKLLRCPEDDLKRIKRKPDLEQLIKDTLQFQWKEELMNAYNEHGITHPHAILTELENLQKRL